MPDLDKPPYGKQKPLEVELELNGQQMSEAELYEYLLYLAMGEALSTLGGSNA